MSVKVMGAVFDLDIPPNLKLVLLAYADHAHHDGTSVHPAAASVAEKTSYSVRSVKRIARELEALGYLLEDGRGPHGTRKWRIPFDQERGVILSPLKSGGVTSAHVGGDKSSKEGVTSDALGVTPTSPEPSLELELEPSFNRGEFSKNDQTPLALAKAAILTDLNNGKMYARKPEIFKRVFDPLQTVEIGSSDGLGTYVKLSHPEPGIFDDRLYSMLASALIGVFGEAVTVTIEARDE